MAKKPKRREKFAVAGVVTSSPIVEPISTTGKKVIAAGIGVLILGFFVLTFSDRLGRNWASCLSPFLILGGYALIGLGIFIPDSPPSTS